MILLELLLCLYFKVIVICNMRVLLLNQWILFCSHMKFAEENYFVYMLVLRVLVCVSLRHPDTGPLYYKTFYNYTYSLNSNFIKFVYRQIILSSLINFLSQFKWDKYFFFYIYDFL